MLFDALILQLKALAPRYNNNVAGAAEFAIGIDRNTWLPQPAAYVVIGPLEAGENESMNGLYQRLTQHFQVVVSLDNRADRRGQTAMTTVPLDMAAICPAILNWRPDSAADAPAYQACNPYPNRAARGIRLLGGELLEYDRARLFWAFDFAFDTIITEWDGWQQPSVPLTDIQVNAPEGSFGSFDAPISQ